MKLIVMGAGYVGMALLIYLQSQPHDLYITTTKADRVEALKAYGNVLHLSSTKDEDFQELINSCDGMIILVAPNSSKNYQETYLNTAKDISFALKNRQSPFYILYTSSTSVCEGLENGWVTEETPLSPISENAKILAQTEQQYLNSGVNACVLRLGGIYGPGRELVNRAKRFSGIEMPGTGEEPTNNIHVEDIVSGIAFCLDHSLTGLYHLVNDDHPTRKELYSTICQANNIPGPIWNPIQLSLKKGGYKISNEKIKREGFVFKHPLECVDSSTL